MTEEEFAEFAKSHGSKTIREMNAEIICDDAKCREQIEKLEKLEKFLADFGFLTFGRDFVLSAKYSFSVQNISTALELTMGSIVSCCKSGCIADANTLLRKYRDDLFYYLYIAVYNSMDSSGKTSKEAK